ncbi:hypothetical protein RchiOBHm_Chr1g0353471 [Rosa chinensis]|uniref:Uncharacterized protein n=1 Tax=Rosa chinensis TaxID=74649 RepID=A0A2P6SGU8_ROSCH|nr:hypothetical protein RchiOBHm_Chr1g0353471 [Rosa chinensis]
MTGGGLDRGLVAIVSFGGSAFLAELEMGLDLVVRNGPGRSKGLGVCHGLGVFFVFIYFVCIFIFYE